MADTVEDKLKVLEASYDEEMDSIVLVGECREQHVRHRLPSSLFEFGDKDKATEMKKTAAMMVGKTINMVFNPDLVTIPGKVNENK